MDCYAGLTCSGSGECMKLLLDGTTFTNDDPVCDACDASAANEEAEGGSACMVACTDSSECAANLFCCPNWYMCMDTTTYSTVGPNCDAAAGNDGTTTDPPTQPPAQVEYDGFTLAGEYEQCGTANTRFDFMRDDIEGCAAACYNLGGCYYFLYDPNDGECIWE